MNSHKLAGLRAPTLLSTNTDGLGESEGGPGGMWVIVSCRILKAPQDCGGMSPDGNTRVCGRLGLATLRPTSATDKVQGLSGKQFTDGSHTWPSGLDWPSQPESVTLTLNLDLVTLNI